MRGLIHIYCGDGKGKTTAAAGLAVRASGAGKEVIFAQFLKDGSSSEVEFLGKAHILVCYLSSHRGFFAKQREEEKSLTVSENREYFERIADMAKYGPKLLVLDEIIDACNLGIIDEESLTAFLENKPEELEVVLTGRNPSERLMDLADYITEMKKIKHPFDRGIPARSGIEF